MCRWTCVLSGRLPSEVRGARDLARGPGWFTLASCGWEWGLLAASRDPILRAWLGDGPALGLGFSSFRPGAEW